jgi:ABC-type transporter Mla subunit MlaD
MNTTQTSTSTLFKVGIFTILGLVLTAAVSIAVNDRPFWWRPCQLVRINVEDATGLKTKSPIRSLGIEIGFLKSVSLSESHVTLGICITAPVEVLPSTRAYIRGEGFLGDKFVELKPVKYTGVPPSESSETVPEETSKANGQKIPSQSRTTFSRKFLAALDGVLNQLGPSSAWAQTDAPAQAERPVRKTNKGGREIPVGEESQDIQHLVTRVDELVHQMTGLTDNLKQAINPDDLRRTMRQLNQTLENASKTLAPEGGLNKTAQRTLAKLEDAIEQLRNIMTRISRGEGPIGTLVANEEFATGMKEAVKNLNRILNKVADVRFVVDVGAMNLTGISGGRGWFQLGIWPKPDRYYLLGISGDSRGRIQNTFTKTTVNGQVQNVETQTIDQTGLLLTGMLGKVFFNNRLDLSLGALYGDGAASVMVNLGPYASETRIQFRNDIYIRNAAASFDDRMSLSLWPTENIYLRTGVESFRGLFDKDIAGGGDFFIGGGISFDDNEIKLLFTFL